MEDKSAWRIVARSLAIWFFLILAEIMHGVLRAILLAPMVGEFRSNQIGVFSGSAFILVIACLSVRWIGAQRLPELLSVGLIWLALTAGFELGFGRWVMALTWNRIAADSNMVEGGLLPIGLVVLFFSPWLASK